VSIGLQLVVATLNTVRESALELRTLRKLRRVAAAEIAISSGHSVSPLRIYPPIPGPAKIIILGPGGTIIV
jgi:hypothetical protein